ncbi:MAG TPA: protein kinase [Thermoanaerobaculia bacterium]|nr:protein kinase [Thermoanaerobaculia bacterium]
MTIAQGVQFGPYEILRRLGAGGMGEVWRARDHRLQRDVAIKVLPDDFRDEAAMQRFAREARAAGSLNHPGLVTILDVGSTDGSPYIVMEMLEGSTLREAMAARMPRRKVLDYAVQIASALAVAHERGIVHRDLKPENLFITSGQRVKILDFGLAKSIEDTKSVDPNRTTSRLLTGAGNVVGTPAYMSPEQVRAEPLDARTDIFSFGALLYELLAGRPAFDGDTSVDTLHKVLHSDPEPLEKIVPDVPPILAIIVRRCLEKAPRDRFRSASDLAFQLDTLAAVQKSVAVATAPRKRRDRAAIVVLSLLLAAATAGLAVLAFRRGDAPATVRSYKQLTFNEGVESFPALAPDGKSFAYVSSHSGNRDIYVQRVDGRGAINVTSDSQDDDSEPAFSPDGSQLAFRSERDGGGIFLMGVTGESVRRLTNEGHNPSWSPDGTEIVVSTVPMELRPHYHPFRGSLLTVDTRTGERRLLFDADKHVESDAMQPSWSPDGKRIAFWGVSNKGERFIWTIDPRSRAVTRVISGRSTFWNPVWAPDGRTLYFGSDADGTLNLWRVAIDDSTGAPRAAPEPLSLPAAISGNFSVSRENEVAYCTVSRWVRVVGYPLDLARGTTEAPRIIFGGSEEILSFEPSPDGKTIAFTTAGGSQEDVFLANTVDGRTRQLTNDAAKDRGVSWAPNGRTLYFYGNRSGTMDIWSVDADGGALSRVTNERDLATIGAEGLYLPNASPDGKTLVARTNKANVFVHLDRPIGQRVETFGERILSWPKWSPDGSRLLGRVGNQIVVYSVQTRRLDTISDRGSGPAWVRDGKRIAIFEKERVNILDLQTRRVTTISIAPPPGADVIDETRRFAPDGSMIYVQQALEQGDIWMMRFKK